MNKPDAKCSFLIITWFIKRLQNSRQLFLLGGERERMRKERKKTGMSRKEEAGPKKRKEKKRKRTL